MAATAVTVTGAPAPPVGRPRVLIVASAFVAAATVMYFVGLFGLYLASRSATIANGNAWLPEGVKIELTQPNLMFFTLILSVITVQWANWAIKNDDRPHTYLALGLTLLLGFAYINMAAYNYSIMQFHIEAGAASVLVYAITGSHILMAVAAMAFVALMTFRALGGQFTSRQHDGIAAAALYWHAMVAVFAIIWIAIYVTK